MNRTTTFIVILVLLVLGFGYLYLHNRGSLKTRKVEVGFRGYAAINRLLAAQRFLERFGEKVEARRSLRAMRGLPARNDTLFMLRHSDSLTSKKTYEIQSWVSRGGHLVLGPEDLKNSRETSLLARFSIIQEKAVKAGKRKIRWFGNSQTLTIEFTTRTRFLYRGYKRTEVITDRHGVLILRTRYGRGLVTALSDPSILYNDRIAQHDHAALLNLITLPRRSSTYWFLYDNRLPGFFELLIDNLWPSLAALALLILLWLSASLRRFGPILPGESIRRRSLLEHIAASGKLLWRCRQEQVLIDAARNRLQQRIEMRYPGWTGLSNETLIENLSGTTGIVPEKINFALNADCRHKEHDFTQMIHLLERLRKAL